MKRKSTDRKYGKEFFLFLAIMMLTFGVVLRGQNFSQLKSTLIRMKPVYVGAALFLSVFFVAAEGCMICFLLRSVGIIVHVRQCWIFICRVLFFRDHAVCIGRTAHAALLYEKGRYSSAGGNRGADGCCDSL